MLLQSSRGVGALHPVLPFDNSNRERDPSTSPLCDQGCRKQERCRGRSKPRLKSDLEKAARNYKAKTGVGCDGFHLKVSLDLTKEKRGEVEFLGEVEQCGRSPQQACTRMFFVIPKYVTSERPIALMPAMICWWKPCERQRLQNANKKYRIEWYAADGRNGGAERTVWETLLGMRKRSRSGGLGLGPAKAFERVSLPVVCAWATYFSFS